MPVYIGARRATLSPDQGGGYTPVPLALGDRIAFVGCSVEYDSNWYGYVPALLRRINHRLQAYPYSDFTFPGSKTTDFAINMPYARAAKAHALFYGESVNDTIPGSPPTAAVSNAAMLADLQSFGAQPQAKIIFLATSRKTQSAVDNGNVALLDTLNAYRASLHGTMIGRALVVFLNAPYDISTSGADVLCTRDTVHDNTRGAFFNRAKQYAALMEAYLPAGRTLPVAGVAPGGNLSTNPFFSGTGGTITGAGAANISGTVANSCSIVNAIASGVTGVADSSVAGRQRVTLSGNQPGTSDIYVQSELVAGLLRGKKYQAMVRYQLSNVAGNGPSTLLRNLSILSPSPSYGTDGRGGMITGYGDIPSPYRGGIYPINPITGLNEDIGEPWMVSRPQAFPINGSSRLRMLFTPFVGAVDIMIDFTDFIIRQIVEPKDLPFYQAARVTRADGGIQRFFQAVLGPYTVGGIFPNYQVSTTDPIRYTQAQANASWIIQPGDWSGDPDSFDGVISVSTDGGATYTPVVPSINAAGWTWAASGLVTGNKVKIEITATSAGFGSTSAAEIVTIT